MMENQQEKRCVTRRTVLVAGLGLIGAVLASRIAPAAGALASARSAYPGSGYPDHIVNGDFSYPGSLNASYGGYIDPINGMYNPIADAAGRPNGMRGWHTIVGWDFDKFRWLSTQPYTEWGMGGTEYVHEASCQVGGIGAEVVCHSSNNAIYQDVATMPGAVYFWKLAHWATQAGDVDILEVRIGAPGVESAQIAYRGTSYTGDRGASVGTRLSSPHSPASWYCGAYECPSAQALTRFTFKSIRGAGVYEGGAVGNMVRYISFEIAYRLSFDYNGGTGSMTQPHKDSSGIYHGHYVKGAEADVSADGAGVKREGYTFLGWSETRVDPVTSREGAEAVDIVGDAFTMPAAHTTLYAVWAKNPTITTYVVCEDGSVKKVGSKTVSFGLTANVVSDVWMKSQLTQASSVANAPSDYVQGWWPSSQCAGSTLGSLTVYEDMAIYANVAYIDVELVKTWNGGSKVRPSEVTGTLTGSDGSRRAVTIASPSWKTTVKRLPRTTSAGAVISYTFVEDGVEHFDAQVTGGTISGFTVANTYVIPTADVSVTKRWEGNFAHRYIPGSIEVHLVGSDGSDRKLTLTEGGGWRGIFADVPLTDFEANEISYEVREVELHEFDCAVTGSVSSGFTVTNTCIIGDLEGDKDPAQRHWL